MITVRSIAKKFSFFLIGFLLVIFLAKGWQLYTDGFRIDKITTELLPKTGIEIPAEEIQNALNQPYTYLDKGCQAYVFESQDKKYVLKLVRYHKYQDPFWSDVLPLLPFGKSYQKSRIEFRKRSSEHTLNSYRISAALLQVESGTLYVHLEKTSFFSKKMTLIDRFHRSYFIDLDNTGFILQRKALPLSIYLKNCKNAKTDLLAKKAIHSFFSSLHKLYTKSIVIKDTNCVRNSGILDGNLVIIDLGSFYQAKALHDSIKYTNDMNSYIKYFRKWLSLNYPQMVPVFDEEFQKFIAL